MALGGRALIFSPIERMIAWRYLKPRRREGFVSVIAGFSFLGILLGVATLIIVMSVMNGFRKELLEKILGFNSHLVVQGLSGTIPDYAKVAERIRTVKGVTRAVPVVEGQVLATANETGSGGYVRGLGVEDFRAHPLLVQSLVDGKLEDFKGEDAAIIGYRMARNLGLRVGDRVRLTSATGCIQTPFGCTPRMKTFRVVGLFNVGMAEYDRIFVFLPLEAAQLYFDQENLVTSIEVDTDNPDTVERVESAIGALRVPNVRVTSWKDRHKTFFNALKVERTVMFLILTLIIIVAAFNIISSLVMLVKDKTQAIAILRTMGATRGTVMRVFILSGASIGIVGTLAGVGLGLLVAGNIDAIKVWLESVLGTNLFPDMIYFLSRLPAEINPREVAEIGGMSIGLSLLATIYPSWKAARLDPVEALRNE
jgi:lipoprotein-releasing system permease protein